MSPTGSLLDNLLVALTRLPRGEDKGSTASLIRALARDLKLDFDPLDCVLGEPWLGERPQALNEPGVWRTVGDTVERLENLALALVNQSKAPDPAWVETLEVLNEIQDTLRPNVKACGPNEIDAVVTALDGRFVEPGPSGAPTRGRPEVLPTGRNFYRWTHAPYQPPQPGSSAGSQQHYSWSAIDKNTVSGQKPWLYRLGARRT